MACCGMEITGVISRRCRSTCWHTFPRYVVHNEWQQRVWQKKNVYGILIILVVRFPVAVEEDFIDFFHHRHDLSKTCFFTIVIVNDSKINKTCS